MPNDIPPPVTLRENDEVKGHALCQEHLFKQHVEKAKGLRDRQSAYAAALPSDPNEVIRAALKIMHPNGSTYPGRIEEAQHLSRALEAMLLESNIDGGGPFQRSAHFISESISDALLETMGALDRMSDILGNGGRVAREASASAAAAGAAASK